MSLIRSSTAPQKGTGEAVWFVFSGNELLVPLTEGESIVPITIPFGTPLPFQVENSEYLGADGDTHFYAADLGNAEVDESLYRTSNIRNDYKLISYDMFKQYAYASEVVSWMRNFKFCGKCGTETVRVEHERAKRCPNCGHMAFPRLSPAVIVAVKHEGKVLLGHNKHFRENHYSTLAGFIDPGESVEEAVQREIMEEVGVRVKNIQYVTSQPWPFPDSLMLGFTAEYDSGEITPDGVEITDADWFTKEMIADISIPTKAAVARTLIETVLGPIDCE